MVPYQQAGDIPPKRHTRYRRPDVGLYYEELKERRPHAGPDLQRGTSADRPFSLPEALGAADSWRSQLRTGGDMDDLGHTWSGPNLHAREPMFDPAGPTKPQRHGAACLVCDKRWPRPQIRVGHFPDGSAAYACEDCAPAVKP
ncbi:hypothetical protein ETD83_25495 [Actinomadura soli]|uniref:Uncharacterized protein n=1 Tax=Actinomadura soli TaxID=2508997 RepID=A0A5C4J6H1_9ACTN|nr:hypothetical protein ETD83_25495 [Actinomadura soli]